MKIIQIKGANGSGKTTIVKQLIASSNNVRELKGLDDSGVHATYMSDLGWAAIGKYPDKSKMGGCDNLKTIDNIKSAICKTIEYCGDEGAWIVFEGMMISTIKSTFYNFLRELPGMYPDYNIEPMFVILDACTEKCVSRIMGRGTMRTNLNLENIRNKCNIVRRHAKTYDQDLVRWMKVDSIGVDNMLPVFLELVGDREILGELYERYCIY